MDDLQKMAEALNYWQDIAAMYKVEIDKLKAQIESFHEAEPHDA